MTNPLSFLTNTLSWKSWSSVGAGIGQLSRSAFAATDPQPGIPVGSGAET